MGSPDIQYRRLVMTTEIEATLSANPVVAPRVPPVGESLIVLEKSRTPNDPEELCSEIIHSEMAEKIQCLYSVTSATNTGGLPEITIWCNKQRGGNCLFKQVQELE